MLTFNSVGGIGFKILNIRFLVYVLYLWHQNCFFKEFSGWEILIYGVHRIRCFPWVKLETKAASETFASLKN
jgi:hypothetical protein